MQAAGSWLPSSRCRHVHCPSCARRIPNVALMNWSTRMLCCWQNLRCGQVWILQSHLECNLGVQKEVVKEVDGQVHLLRLHPLHLPRCDMLTWKSHL